MQAYDSVAVEATSGSAVPTSSVLLAGREVMEAFGARATESR